ncbi:MAG: LysM peptidoglycan-binding domain-containing protein [Frankia sp.]
MTTPPRRAARLIAALGVLTGFTVVTAVLLIAGPHRSDLPHRPGKLGGWVSSDPEHALATLVGIAAWLCLLWLAAGVFLAGLARLPGATGRAAAVVSGRMLPTALRGALEVTLGVTLAAGGAAPALAAGPAHGSYPTTTATSTAVSGIRPGAGPSLSAIGWPDLDLPASGASSNAPGAARTSVAVPPVADSTAGRPPTAPAAAGGPSVEPPATSVPAGSNVAPVATLTGGLGLGHASSTLGASAGRDAATAPDQAPTAGSAAASPAATQAAAGWPDLDLPSGSAGGIAPVDDTALPRAAAAGPVSDPSITPVAESRPTAGAGWPDLDLPVTPTAPHQAAGPSAPTAGAPTTQPTVAPAHPTPARPASSAAPATPTPTGTPAGSTPTTAATARRSATAPSPATSSPADSTAQPPGWPDLGGASGDLITGSSGRGTGSSVADDSAEVVVHRGDSLWSIVARQLGPGATDEQIAAAWPAWWAANREVIGPNPNLILPGQVLRPPAGP